MQAVGSRLLVKADRASQHNGWFRETRKSGSFAKPPTLIPPPPASLPSNRFQTSARIAQWFTNHSVGGGSTPTLHRVDILSSKDAPVASFPSQPGSGPLPRARIRTRAGAASELGSLAGSRDRKRATCERSGQRVESQL